MKIFQRIFVYMWVRFLTGLWALYRSGSNGQVDGLFSLRSTT